MISPEQALEKVLRNSHPLGSVTLDIRQASGLVLAESVRCTDSLPRFDCSAMDGFAVKHADIAKASKSNPVRLKLIGEVRAGTSFVPHVTAGTTVKISTGGKIPAGADVVVMKEDCEEKGAEVIFRESEARLANIRLCGEEILKGKTAVKRGTRLNPGSIAWLVSMGVRRVTVCKRPVVGLLRSGDEVADFGRSPRSTQVRDTHGISIPLALRDLDLDVMVPSIVRDHPWYVERAFRKLMKQCDVVITTGGISVGEHDLFKEIAEGVGVEMIFHNVSQKPGKPLAFGKRGSRLWFGLPGNPVSALACFYVYLRPGLLQMMGVEPESIYPWFKVRASEFYPTHPARAQFLRGILDQQSGGVSFAEKQGSHCLGSFAEANVLIKIAPSAEKGKPGDELDAVRI
jgi:molybdopterin molybdotransferase